MGDIYDKILKRVNGLFEQGLTPDAVYVSESDFIELLQDLANKRKQHLPSRGSLDVAQEPSNSGMPLLTLYTSFGPIDVLVRK